jgi:hypothetical protein
MKVTIEYDDKYEAIQALKAERWQGALWKLDQELRGIVKHGYIGNREATDCEIEVYNKCREMLREAMNDNDITFDI